MKDPFGWINKIKDIIIKNSITIVADNVRKLEAERVAALEATAQHNLLSETHLDTDPFSPPADGDLITAQNGKWGKLDIGGAGLFLTSTGTLLDWDTPDGGIPAAHASSHESGGGDTVAAGEIRETSGPTDLVIGAIANGEFLKRVGGTIVSAAVAGGSVPTGTGFRHVTAGVEDAASKLVDTADINADQVTYAKIQNVSAAARLLGRGSGAGAGDVEELTASAPLAVGVAGITVSNATTAAVGVVELATDGENAANVVVQGNDIRINALTTLGDLLSHNGTNVVRVPGGSDGYVLVYDISGGPFWDDRIPTNSYACGSKTISNEKFMIMVKRMQLTSTQRYTGQGTSRLRIT